MPTISPNGSTFELSSETLGTTIRYTIDGTTLTKTLYNPPFAVMVSSVTSAFTIYSGDGNHKVENFRVG